MSGRKFFALCAAGLLLLAGAGYGIQHLANSENTVQAPVDGKPHDGDTFRVLIDGRSEPVRVLGIQAPEVSPDDCYGPEAQAEVRRLLTGQTVVLSRDPDRTDRDFYNRLLRYVEVPEIGDLGAYLVENGYAQVYEQYPVPRTEEYLELQQQARETQRGGWSEESKCSW